MKVIVVHDGHKMYQDDNETYLTVSDGNPVLSKDILYTTKKDYTQTRKDVTMADPLAYYTHEDPDTVIVSKREYKELLAVKKKLEELTSKK